MKLVNRQELNADKWEHWLELVSVNKPFLSLDYLDCVSQNLLFVINDQETGGMPLPYFEKWGVKTLYMPVFCRWIDWIGEVEPDKNELTQFLKSIFKQGDIYFRRPLLSLSSEELVYQSVEQSTFRLNNMAKRKLKSSEKETYDFRLENAPEKSLELIRSALEGKFETLRTSNFDTLEVLVRTIQNNSGLRVLNLYKKDRIMGSLLLISSEERTLYLKGACEKDSREKGGMYALMQHAIQWTFESNRTFDFGGSRISGVRQFNQSFGGQDQIYFRYTWNDGPFWYSWAKKIRNKWRKK